MSVINQMLRDLEAREQRAKGEGTLSPRAMISTPLRGRLLILGLILLLGGVEYWWLSNTLDTSHRTDPVNKQQELDPGSLASNSLIQSLLAQTRPSATAISENTKVPLPERIDAHQFIEEKPAAIIKNSKPMTSSPGASQDKSTKLVIREVKVTRGQQMAQYRTEAQQALQRSDSPLAIAKLRALLALEPNEHASRKQLAALYYGQGRGDDAAQLLRQGINLAPQDADFRLMLARVYLGFGDERLAFDTLNGYRPHLNEHIDYYVTLAALSQQRGRLDQAVDFYRQLILHDSTQARWWLGLGISLDKQGASPKALEAYRHALSMGMLNTPSQHYLEQRIAQLEVTYDPTSAQKTSR